MKLREGSAKSPRSLETESKISTFLGPITLPLTLQRCGKGIHCLKSYNTAGEGDGRCGTLEPFANPCIGQWLLLLCGHCRQKGMLRSPSNRNSQTFLEIPSCRKCKHGDHMGIAICPKTKLCYTNPRCSGNLEGDPKNHVGVGRTGATGNNLI